MKKTLFFALALCFSGALLINCSSDKGGGGGNSKAPADAHETEVETTPVEGSATREAIKKRYKNTFPNTGLDVSYVEGDYNVVDTHQIVVFDFGGNITRVVAENRYFLQNGDLLKNVGCDVFYYANDAKNIEQLATENELTIQDAIYKISAGIAGELFGGSYNPDGQWYFQGSFVNNVEKCSQSITSSKLMEAVRDGRATVKYLNESNNVLDALNYMEL